MRHTSSLYLSIQRCRTMFNGKLKIMEIDKCVENLCPTEPINKTPREFFRITSGLLSCVIHGGLVWPDKNVRPACALANAGSPWYIARLEKWFRRRGNQETPKCSLRFGWRRIAFSREHTRTPMYTDIRRDTYNGAFVTRCTWLARVILVRFAGFWTNVRTHIETCKRRITRRSRTFNRDYCES